MTLLLKGKVKEVKILDKEQYEQVTDALVNFIVRVANGNSTSETEVAVLPEVARILVDN